MTYADLISRESEILWFGSQPENLVEAHKTFFAGALYELQRAVACLRYRNVNVFPQCATYFNCGMTVLPAPRGRILKVYAIDKLNPTTGLEDATADDNWCKKVHYQQVEYCFIQSYVKLCQQCTSGSVIDTVSGALLSGLFGIYRNKSRYPAPTDVGLESLPSLPRGFHYPQSSTDATGRSPSGVWALDGGRMYIAPWIQSTETLVIEWNGIKNTWNDADLVDDDEMFRMAVRAHVAIQHYSFYEENPGKLAEFKAMFFEARKNLIRECDEQNRIRLCGEAGNRESAARGLGATDLSTSIFSNERQQATASCPVGETGDDVTVVLEAGTVGSALSVADANARALQQAADEANRRLVCETATVTFYNTPQTATAQCEGSEEAPTPTGNPVTVTIAAGAYSSTVSQAIADAAALAAAQTQAEAQLVCTWFNSEQEYEANCPSGTTGTPVTKTIAAGVHSSTISQSIADADALNAAKVAAEAEIVCTTSPPVYSSQNTSAGWVSVVDGCASSVTITISPGRFTSLISQADANTLALNYARGIAQQIAVSRASTNQCGNFSQTF